MAIDRLELMRSHLGGGPARYERLVVHAGRGARPWLSDRSSCDRRTSPSSVTVTRAARMRTACSRRPRRSASTWRGAGAVVVTGGLGGVMRAASRGALAAGGETIGILPGDDPSEANEFVRWPIATGLGVARNLVVVTAADAVIAVGGKHGTLSEIGLALRMGRHVVALSSWRVESDQRLGGPRVHRARTPRDGVELVIKLARSGPASPA